MNNLNNCILSGRLVRDPEFKEGKTKICSFTIANNIWIGKDHTNFFDCVAFGNLAELVQKYFKKGDLIYGSFKTKQEVWENDNQKKSKVKFLLENIDLHGRSKKNDNDLDELF